jgi:hypothetical protein
VTPVLKYPKIYPALRRAGINFSALKRITGGFMAGKFSVADCVYVVVHHSTAGAAAMVWAAGKFTDQQSQLV